VLIPAVARRLRRPVRWIESRREHFLATAPDRDQHHRARLGVAQDGTVTAVQTIFTRDGGAYPVLGDVIALNSINHLPGPYRIANVKGLATNVVTHKTFTPAYRGAGRPEIACVLDRLLDRAARRLGMDPLDFPSMRNELGIKGVGESGIVSPVPAIANAVEDALADRGVEIARVPLTAASVWQALRNARRPSAP